MMKKDLFGRRVANFLGESVCKTVDSDVLARLAKARELALSSARLDLGVAVAKPRFVFGVDVAVWQRFWCGLSLMCRFAMPVLVVMVVANEAWRHQEMIRVNELVEFDVRLLDDELPLEAYDDQGFEAFLQDAAVGENG